MKYSAASRLVCLSDVCRFSPSAVTNVVYFMSRSLCLFFRTWCYFYSISAPSFMRFAFSGSPLSWLSLRPPLIIHISCVKYTCLPLFLCPASYFSVLQSFTLAPKSLVSFKVQEGKQKNKISDGLGWWWDPACAVKLQNLYTPSFRVIRNITASA